MPIKGYQKKSENSISGKIECDYHAQVRAILWANARFWAFVGIINFLP